MNKPNGYYQLLGAAVLSVAILGCGWILKSAALDVKNMERTVEVKGLAEREVTADTVIWPVQFSDADNNLEKLVERVEQKNAAVIAFLKLHGFDEQEISLKDSSYRAKVMYFGLSRAYFMAGDLAGEMLPGEKQWRINERSELLPELKKAFAIQAKEMPSTFFNVPLKK